MAVSSITDGVRIPYALYTDYTPKGEELAIVEAPALSMNASGNLGSICYSPWRGLSIARGTWTGTVPNTTLQIEQQNRLIEVAQAWGEILSMLQRESWEEIARSIVWKDRMGSPYTPSGYQYFMKLNTRRKVMGLAIMNEPPTAQQKVYVDNLQYNEDAAKTHLFSRLSKEFEVSIDGYGCEYYKAGPYLSGGRRPIEGEWRFLSRKVPPSFHQDFDVIDLKWYWSRSRAISEFGDVGNWFQKQAQFTT